MLQTDASKFHQHKKLNTKLAINKTIAFLSFLLNSFIKSNIPEYGIFDLGRSNIPEYGVFKLAKVNNCGIWFKLSYEDYTTDNFWYGTEKMRLMKF